MRVHSAVGFPLIMLQMYTDSLKQMEESTHIGQLFLIQIHKDGYAHVNYCKIFVHLLVILYCLCCFKNIPSIS